MTQQELKAEQEKLDKLRVAYDVIRDISLGNGLSHSEIECFEFVKNYIAKEMTNETTTILQMKLLMKYTR